MPRLVDLPPVECWTRLEATSTASVAFVDDQDVHVEPVNVCVRDREVWFRSTDGAKLRAARAGRRMAVAIGAHDDLGHTGWSVTARGPAALAPEGPPDEGRPTVRPWRRDAAQGAWVRVAVDTITGRELALGRVADGVR